MASQDKLVKALESLRVQMIAAPTTDLTIRKKEKISHCSTIADTMCNLNIRNVPNFTNLLSITLEVLLQLCDDPESDVRMMADECLNRIIRAMSDGHMAKIQVELHKEIKKNGSARTLRAALSRFSQLCHFIRPQKGKPFMQILVPCIVKIAAREEESVLETLALSLSKIMQSLGRFASDNDIKSLLRAFLQNLSSSSAGIRRTAASSVLIVCQSCRKPNVFITFVLNTLLDIVIPVQEDISAALLLGVFNCLRSIVPHTTHEEAGSQIQGSFGVRKNPHDSLFAVDRLVQVYELCLYYTTHVDHNVVNAALETLHILLEKPGEHLLEILLRPQGINRSRIYPMDGGLKLKTRSLSETSVATSLAQPDESVLLESESLKLSAPDVEKWIETSKLSHTDLSEGSTTANSFDRLSLNNYFDEQAENDEIKPELPSNTNEYSNMFIGAVNLHDNESEISNSTNREVDTDTKFDTDRKLSVDDLIDRISLRSSGDLIEKPVECPMKEINTGEFTDENIPVIFCCRHITRSFLLTGYPNGLIPDAVVRVSVKSLALTCISALLKLYPDVIKLYLDKGYGVKSKSSVANADETEQKISDVLKYSDHNDPQLRGIVRVLIGSLIQSVLVLNQANYDDWLNSAGIAQNTNLVLMLEPLIKILIKGLEDESSICNRQSLIAAKQCLRELIASVNSPAIIPILNILPIVVRNPYWLVKVQLVEVLENLPYVTIQHVTGNCEFQDKVVHNVLFHLLSDDDLRVRTSTAKAIVRIIPYLYYQRDQPNQLPVTAKAIEYRYMYINKLFGINIEANSQQKHYVSAMPPPFCGLNQNHILSEHIEKSLSRITSSLEMLLLESSSKYLTYGCCEALSMLSVEYYTTVYNRAWHCVNQVRKINPTKPTTLLRTNSQTIDTSLLSMSLEAQPNSYSGLLNLCVAMMTSSMESIDLSSQTWLLNLAGNLFSGSAIRNLKPAENLNHERNVARKNWEIYSDPTLAQIAEQLLNHVIKLLNIFSHVLEENVPTIPASKTVLPTLPNAPTLSPIKRKSKSDAGDKNKLLSPAKVLNDKDDKLDKKSDIHRLNTMGYFASNPHYMKLYELLKTAYGNYKITLEEGASEKFLRLLKCTLNTLCQLLEMCTIQETGRIAEEVLQHMQSCVSFEPTVSIQCVQQLLKCLIGTNLCAQLEELDLQVTNKKNTNNANMSQHGQVDSFYINVFQIAYAKFTNCISTINVNNKTDKDDCTMLGYLRRKGERKASFSFKNFSRGTDNASLANYIRLFEPMVIKALKQYTVTSDVYLQCKVLQLLSQLFHLRVNYCLLDSDQIFIDFVLKQFEFIEEGQIPHAEDLIPKIFHFLVHLSYEKQHSKSIISIPKIINLCDGLMASGQSPATHCIPALKPVIEDIFLLRDNVNNTTTEIKDLETTRDVLFSMLLRLVEYHQVLELLTVVINESRYNNDNGERWVKWSRLVVDAVVPTLAQRRVRLETREAQVALHSLLCVLNPSIFKAMDPLLSVLFQDPPFIECSVVIIQRWLGAVLSIFLTISQIKEDVLLLKIVDVRPDIPIRSVYAKYIENYDPLNVSSSVHSVQNISPEEIFARFVFRVVHITSEKCLKLMSIYKQDANYVLEQLASFLLFCIHMFESGSHCKIANMAMNLLRNSSIENQIPIADINGTFLQLAIFAPIITFQWCYILTLLNYSDQKYWAKVLQNINNDKIGHLTSNDSNTNKNFNCINLEIVRQGGIILYSDYICENITDCENLTWFLVNHIETVIKISNEPPVAELIAAIHRNSAASGLFVQAVAARCQRFDQPNFVNKLLKCLENVHPSQSGPLLVFLVPNLLNCRQLALSRMAAALASRRTELLLTMSIEEVSKQLSKDDLTVIMEVLLQTKLAKKHGTFVSLLNKLASRSYDLSPLELDQGRTINPDNIRKIVINKTWYLSQVKMRCCQTTYLGAESAELLNKLDYEDILSIMSQNEFNKLCLKDCIKFALNMAGGELDEVTPLLRATIEALLTQVVYFKSLMPKPHQVYQIAGRPQTTHEVKYTHRLNELFSDSIFWETFFEIAPTITCYLDLIKNHTKLQVFESNHEDLCKFSVLCLESVVFVITQSDSDKCCTVQSSYLDIALQCANTILKQTFLSNILGLDTHASWLCSCINSIYKLVQFLLLNNEPLPSLSKFGLLKTFENANKECAANACYQLSILVSWLEKMQGKSCRNIPNFMFTLIKSLIISLARLPLVNSYILTPPDVWDQMWQVQLTGLFSTQVPPLPIEFLQELEILEQFIFRITLLGWVSRQQFEETWMCLLSVLSASPNEAAHDSEDVTIVIQANSLAVQAITALLMQTLLVPVPGNSNISKLIHAPREKNLSEVNLSSQKLKAVQNTLYWRYKQNTNLPDTDLNLVNIFERPNLDRVQQPLNKYTYGQVSVEYLWTVTKMVDIPEQQTRASIMFERRQASLRESTLDINSCLHFLLDLYSQWIRPQSGTPLRLLNEVVRSVLAISDLFTEKAQFQWMLDVCMDLSKSHPPEDEVLHQYVVLGVCKAAAVLVLDLDTYELVKRLVENSLKSGFLPARIASLHGILYLLQSSVMSNTVIGGMSDEMLLIQPMAIDYVQYHITINNGTLNQSEDHQQVMWALAFYLLENVEETITDTEIVPNVLQVVMMLLAQNSHLSMTLHNTLLQGLERLIVSKSITGKVAEQVTKLAVEKLKHPNPGFAFPALQLLLACMYTEGEKQINAAENVNGVIEIDPDLLVQAVEKISAIFDRIKKGYPYEAELLCAVLPHLLNDFFPPSEILTKVIGEFLSPQQPHPRLLSNVVFEVFEKASHQNQLILLQEWVVFSLSNFTQCLPIGMATWCLICFFISASTNQWLRAQFPHVQSRIGKYEYEDRKMLCVAGTDFYRQLTDDAQKKKFVETFQKVADNPGTPFKDLILSL